MKALRAPDVPGERGLARRQGVEPLDRRAQQADIANGRRKVERFQQLGEKRENLGIGGFGVFAVKDFIARLKIFGHAGTAAMILLAKDLAHIGVTGGFRPLGHVGLHHGHGEIGTRHHLAAQGVCGDIGAGADILAIKVKQRLGRLQDVGGDFDGPGGFESGQKPLPDGSRLGLGCHHFTP